MNKTEPLEIQLKMLQKQLDEAEKLCDEDSPDYGKFPYIQYVAMGQVKILSSLIKQIQQELVCQQTIDQYVEKCRNKDTVKRKVIG